MQEFGDFKQFFDPEDHVLLKEEIICPILVGWPLYVLFISKQNKCKYCSGLRHRGAWPGRVKYVMIELIQGDRINVL